AHSGARSDARARALSVPRFARRRVPQVTQARAPGAPRPGALMITPFKNQHLSYSRLSRFETCPASYKFHYIEKQKSEPGLPLRFGKAVHAALEGLLKEVVDE